ncbi:unnamed protein product [Chrysoparadoxa australica]
MASLMVTMAAAPPSDTPLITGAVRSLSWSVKEAPAPQVIEVEAAGRAYWSYAARVLVKNSEPSPLISNKKPAAGEADAPGEEEIVLPELVPDNLDDFTYYQVLGFDEYGGDMTDDKLKKAYRQAVLRYHPDKTGSTKGDDDEVFLLVQKAHQTLSDLQKRRAYDSSLDFDDSIPGAEQGKGDDFYDIYGPVFHRNERFAVIVPVPRLGDKDTPINEVRKFYEYWLNFESWRDFTLQAAEHNLDDAEDRQHKRWMTKENEKKNRESKKKEMKRVSALVENARACDPRIKKARDEEQAAKKERQEAREKERNDRIEEERRMKEEKLRLETEAEEKRKQDARAAKEKKDALRQEMRKCRKQLRAKCAEVGMSSVSEADVEFCCESMDWETLKRACHCVDDEVSELAAFAMPLLKEMIASARGSLADAEKAKSDARAAELDKLREIERQREEARKVKARPWSEEERSMLAKAATRFPAGSQNRWETISNFITQSLRLEVPREREDCIAKFQELNVGPVAAPRMPAASPAKAPAAKPAPAKPKTEEPNSEEWSKKQHKQLEAALAKYPATLEKNARWKSIASEVDGKTKKQCVERYKWVKQQLLAKKT